MTTLPDPPKMYRDFTERFPGLADAWAKTSETARGGPLDAKTVILMKLGIAAGALRQGAVHSCVRKAIALGVTREECEQIVPMVAGTMGFPTAVAIWSWMRDEMEGEKD